jgi:hypothetical protein
MESRRPINRAGLREALTVALAVALAVGLLEMGTDADAE